VSFRYQKVHICHVSVALWRRWIDHKLTSHLSITHVLTTGDAWVWADHLCYALMTDNASTIVDALWFVHHNGHVGTQLHLPEQLICLGLQPAPGCPPSLHLCIYRSVVHIVALGCSHSLDLFSLTPPQLLWCTGHSKVTLHKWWSDILCSPQWGPGGLSRTALLQVISIVMPRYYIVLLLHPRLQSACDLFHTHQLTMIDTSL
jgi:hypothetical protein